MSELPFKKILIDPGHGGRDPGASSHGLVEKDVALQLALGLRELLWERGVDVCMTREVDVHLGKSETEDLRARVAKAGEAQADALVSVHCNSHSDPETEGWLILLGGPKDALLSGMLELEARKETPKLLPIPFRGVRHKPEMAVLKLTTIPAVLIEMGFLTNDRDATMLQLASPREVMAVVARGLVTPVDANVVRQRRGMFWKFMKILFVFVAASCLLLWGL